MRGALAGPRLLLRRLREFMAEPISAQERLDKIVVQIAFNMVAEVCSVYVLHADGRLELYATEGLNREAVHQTTMRKGEGLVGLIAASAEALALPDAQNHPAFSYKPETGEEIYLSFLGVPILRGGNTLGVLVVQNKARRQYSEEEVEALQTTSMLMAEMIAAGELQAMLPGPAVLRQPLSLKGTAVVEGVGLGHAVLHEPRVIVTRLVAENVDSEIARLEEAIAALRESIDRLVDQGDVAGPGEHREVLQTFRMFANDRGWLRRLREAVMTGLTAEAAVERVQSDTRAKLVRQTDPYLRDRLHDLDELANRLLHQLTGESMVAPLHALPENAVIVARSMGPAALLDYDRSKLRGLVLEDGGASSHVAIVARALGIPLVGDVANVSSLVEPGDGLILDGALGVVEVRPPSDVEAAYAEKARFGARRQEQYRKLRDVPPVTADGVAIGLHMNAGLLLDLPHVAETGAASIGLFRTELLFMVASRFPRIEQQTELYRSVLDAVGDRPVTFRTLDIGGDKVLPYMARPDEPNPALGWRAIRIGLDRPGLLRSQLRALLRAGGGRAMRIMFPMIASAAEFDAAKAMVGRELDQMARHGHEAARRPQARRHGGSAVPAVGTRRPGEPGGLPVRRLERPDAVSLRHRPGQQARGHALRPAVARHAPRAADDRRCRSPPRHPGDAVRRVRRQAHRGARPGGAGLPQPVDVGLFPRAPSRPCCSASTRATSRPMSGTSWRPRTARPRCAPPSPPMRSAAAFRCSGAPHPLLTWPRCSPIRSSI